MIGLGFSFLDRVRISEWLGLRLGFQLGIGLGFQLGFG